MIELSVAAVILGVLGWDGWRRHIEREHDAVEIANEAVGTSDMAARAVAAHSKTLDQHAIALDKLNDLESRQKATADKVRMFGEEKRAAKPEPYRSIAGASRRG